MKEENPEMLAVSRAGHDKGTLYLVLKSDETYLWLTDGKIRTLDRPKKKKIIHVQLIRHLSDDLKEQMKEITLDAHVRKILKEYQTI